MHTLSTVTNGFTHEKYISELSDICLEQHNDANLSKIISYIESESDPIFWKFDKNNEIDYFLAKFKLKFKIDKISKILTICPLASIREILNDFKISQYCVNKGLGK